MHTKSLFAMTLLLVGSQNLTACTIVDATDDDAAAGEQDAATTNDDSDDTTDDDTTDDDTTDDDTTNDDTTDDNSEADDDGGAQASDDSDETDDGEDAGTTDDDTSEPAENEDDAGGSESPEGDAGDDDTTDTDDTDDSSGDEVQKFGSISLSQMVLAFGDFETVTANASAGFTISTYQSVSGEPVDDNCDTTTVDSCTLVKCGVFSGDAGAGEQPSVTNQAVSAGSIQITGLAEELTLSVGDEAAYTPVVGTSRLWNGGEEVVASAAGTDDVPEFSISLTAPSAITLTSPVLDLGELEVSRSANFEFEWEDGEVGTVTVQLVDATDSGTSMITCTAAADAGGVVVDESLLEDLGEQATLLVSVGTATNETVEDWSMGFTATGTVGSAQVTFSE